MSLDPVALCVDANDPMVLARFWAEALRWRVADGADDDDDEVSLVPTDDTSFQLLFIREPAPRTGLGRLHLDLTTTSLDDQSATVDTLIGRGGSHLDVGQRPEEGHVVLADPEGNEFCIIEPTNNFLATCPRLGAVSCDGTHAVGEFWASALGWPLIWDQDGETAVRAPDLTGSIISWGGEPVKSKPPRNRLHLDLAPSVGGDRSAEVESLIGLGASRADVTRRYPAHHANHVTMVDPDGNEFCVLPPR
ncbi:MAG: VOC family protein [Ilumatobacteraceae bacterium]